MMMLVPLLMMQATAMTLPTSFPVLRCRDACQTTADAIAAADAAHGEPAAAATYVFTVASVGTPGRTVYLNSAADYRAADNVSLEFGPDAAAELRSRLESRSLADGLVGRTFHVRGRARRVPVAVVTGERGATTPGYYQVRITINDLMQVGRPPAN